MSKSYWEEVLLAEIKQAGIPEPVREWRVAKYRKFRFDLAWPKLRTAVEIDGGTWIKGGGRHNRGAGMRSDAEKINLAQQLGWKVYRFTTDMVRDGSAIKTLRKVMGKP